MRILVTGSRGFLGRSICAGLKKNPAVTCLEMDLGIGPALGDLAAWKPEVAIHLAGLARVSHQIGFESYFRSNFLLTVHLLDSLPPGCRILLASSVQVYGNSAREVDEESRVSPVSAYAYSKYLAERAVIKREGVVLRFGNLIGPGQPEGFVVPDLLKKIRAGEKFEPANAEQTRYFIDVEDAAALTLELLQKKTQGIFNVVTPEAYSIGGLYAALCNQTVAPALPSLVISARKMRSVLPDFEFRPLAHTLQNLVPQR